jgi:ribosomal protein S18 acetylase RimI-like enzyme
MTIRTFAPADTEPVVQLWRDCNLVVPQNDPLTDIELKLAHQPELFLVAEYEGQIVGSAMGGYDGHRGWIYYLAVAPGFRRRGLGRQLVEAVAGRLKAIGCPKLNLMVRGTNLEVLEFYKRLGFKDDNVVTLGMRF